MAVTCFMPLRDSLAAWHARSWTTSVDKCCVSASSNWGRQKGTVRGLTHRCGAGEAALPFQWTLLVADQELRQQLRGEEPVQFSKHFFTVMHRDQDPSRGTSAVLIKALDIISTGRGRHVRAVDLPRRRSAQPRQRTAGSVTVSLPPPAFHLLHFTKKCAQ